MSDMIMAECSPNAQAAEEEVSIPVSSDPAASNGVYMAHGGQLKQRCVVTALIVASTFVLLALNTSIMVLTAKAYNITKQLGTAQAPVYSTGAPTIKTRNLSHFGHVLRHHLPGLGRRPVDQPYYHTSLIARLLAIRRHRVGSDMGR